MELIKEIIDEDEEYIYTDYKFKEELSLEELSMLYKKLEDFGMKLSSITVQEFGDMESEPSRITYSSIAGFLSNKDEINKLDLQYITSNLDYLNDIVSTTYYPNLSKFIIATPKTLSNNFENINESFKSR